MAYSMDLRERVVAAVNHGEALAVVARRGWVDRAAVRGWGGRAGRGRQAPGLRRFPKEDPEQWGGEFRGD